MPAPACAGRLRLQPTVGRPRWGLCCAVRCAALVPLHATAAPTADACLSIFTLACVFPAVSPPAVAEEWRHEARGAEGQELVWVGCDQLMDFADK